MKDADAAPAEPALPEQVSLDDLIQQQEKQVKAKPFGGVKCVAEVSCAACACSIQNALLMRWAPQASAAVRSAASEQRRICTGFLRWRLAHICALVAESAATDHVSTTGRSSWREGSATKHSSSARLIDSRRCDVDWLAWCRRCSSG